MQNGYLKPSIKLMQDYASGGSKWVFDSGATNHMTGGKELVKEFGPNYHNTTVSFGNDAIYEVLGFGKVVVAHDVTLVDVMLVKTLGYNLLSVHAFGKMGFAVFIDNDIVVLLLRTICMWWTFRGKQLHKQYAYSERLMKAGCGIAASVMST